MVAEKVRDKSETSLLDESSGGIPAARTRQLMRLRPLLCVLLPSAWSGSCCQGPTHTRVGIRGVVEEAELVLDPHGAPVGADPMLQMDRVVEDVDERNNRPAARRGAVAAQREPR